MITSLSSCGYVKILTCWQYGLAVKRYECDKKKEFIKKYSRVRCHSSLMSHRGRTSPLVRSTWTTLPGYRGL